MFCYGFGKGFESADYELVIPPVDVAYAENSEAYAVYVYAVLAL